MERDSLSVQIAQEHLSKHFKKPQAIVIGHNGQPPWDWDPYLRWALRPLNPVVLIGVTGKSTEAPGTQRKHSVMQWWKDRLFPPRPVLQKVFAVVNRG